jgi:hypothetical protein
MRPGPEMDAEIARKLWRTVVIFDTEIGDSYTVGNNLARLPVPPYSTSLDSANSIIELYMERGWTFKTRREEELFLAGFFRTDGTTYRYFRAETLPAAICYAALAVENGTNIQSR